MHRVAVEASACARVAGPLILVAGVACLDLERWRLMCAMTVTTRFVGVGTDGNDVKTLRAIVAPHTARRTNAEICAEAVAVLTRGQLRDAERIEPVQRRLHGGVAALADLGDRRRKAGIVVTVAARHVALEDVHRVSRARAHVLPGLRHRSRGRMVARPVAEDERGDGDDAEHRDDPGDERGALHVTAHRVPIG